ncbi:Predicted arabinose efflux permease, MFS family [Zunongwangia mangrovi]|uniref:Predicted arabinose efflux permease, MFS family n=1 Tax=Zunongwangia mangrovi TaxID=1334022 RepID=A0A1I1HVE3_9FLAO|nr:MFS transporter [Zunongwangia mangrovi]SFC27876.1 Predicted arabinose efflux permease, MFS family [Zunongwangia mangrovi]
MLVKRRILPLIVIAQFCCTSLWFAGNAVMTNLITDFQLPEETLGLLTSAVQFGFILGTLLFAILSIADRFSPSKVFFLSALGGALFNLTSIYSQNTIETLLLLRFFVGFFLAGIYPIGMKIATDYFQKGLGKSLGFLVGALVIGTAFPHLLKSLTANLPWKSVLIGTSILAVLGGLLIQFFVPDGPFRSAGKSVDLKSFLKVFRNKNFRSSAFGYFGHMWELYSFWAFVPVMLKLYAEIHQTSFKFSLWSFLIIGVGGLACVLGGFIAEKNGTKKTAISALALSGICCLASPLFFSINSVEIFIAFLLFWGISVVADSPLFSTLVAQNADPEVKGTALTIVNCLGYCITIFSILLLNILAETTNSTTIFMILAIGPILGLIALRKKFD